MNTSPSDSAPADHMDDPNAPETWMCQDLCRGLSIWLSTRIDDQAPGVKVFVKQLDIDGRIIEAREGDDLLSACLTHGIDVPYFCWHGALGSVGACRQCAVKQYKDADDKNGRLVMSCMTPASDNTYISIADDEAKEFRETIVSLLMTNHPHDCPVCEEGGHCHLQDMTVMTGHDRRTYRFTKRTHQNQDLGPFISHEMNRCIACYRCVRYYKDYAGGEDLGVRAPVQQQLEAVLEDPA